MQSRPLFAFMAMLAFAAACQKPNPLGHDEATQAAPSSPTDAVPLDAGTKPPTSAHASLRDSATAVARAGAAAGTRMLPGERPLAVIPAVQVLHAQLVPERTATVTEAWAAGVDGRNIVFGDSLGRVYWAELLPGAEAPTLRTPIDVGAGPVRALAVDAATQTVAVLAGTRVFVLALGEGADPATNRSFELPEQVLSNKVLALSTRGDLMLETKGPEVTLIRFASAQGAADHLSCEPTDYEYDDNDSRKFRQIAGAAFSPDGRFAVLISDHELVCIHDLEGTLPERRVPFEAPPGGYQFGHVPDGCREDERGSEDYTCASGMIGPMLDLVGFDTSGGYVEATISIAISGFDTETTYSDPAPLFVELATGRPHRRRPRGVVYQTPMTAPVDLIDVGFADAPVESVWISRDGSTVAAKSSKGRFVVWHPGDASRPAHTASGPSVYRQEMSADGKWLVAGTKIYCDTDGGVCDSSDTGIVQSVSLDSLAIQKPFGTAAYRWASFVRLWQGTGDTLLACQKGLNSEPYDSDMSDADVALVRIDPAARTVELVAETTECPDAATPTGDTWVQVKGRVVQIHDKVAGEAQVELPWKVDGWYLEAFLPPAGDTLVIADRHRHRSLVVDLIAKRATLEVQRIYDAVSPDARFMVAPGQDTRASIDLWLLSGKGAGERVAIGLGAGEDVASAAFSADGRWLVTGHRDFGIRVWDMQRVRHAVEEALARP